MPDEELWFPVSEYRSRVAGVQERIRERGLDGLLAFQAESVTWFTGYFTRAYGAFQLALVPRDRDPVIVCRDQSAFYVRLLTFHTYLLVDGFGFSETIAVTSSGYERLTNYPRRLITVR